jgi:hypothetical protein
VQQYSNEANWAQDGQVLMQPISHFNYFVRGLLQLCSYLVQQLPTKYKVLIKPETFLSAFTMEDEDGERVQARSWTGAPDGSAYDTNLEAGDPSATHTPMDTTNDHETGPDNQIAGGGVGQDDIHTGQLNSIALRRCFALKWMGRQKKRYEFLPIPVDKEPNWEYLRNRWIHGPHGARRIESAKGKKSSRMFKQFYELSMQPFTTTRQNQYQGQVSYCVTHVTMNNPVCRRRPKKREQKHCD